MLTTKQAAVLASRLQAVHEHIKRLEFSLQQINADLTELTNTVYSVRAALELGAQTWEK